MSIIQGTTLPLSSGIKAGWIRDDDPLSDRWGFWITRRKSFEYEPEGGDACIIDATEDVLRHPDGRADVHEEISFRLKYLHPIRYEKYPVPSIEPLYGDWL